MTQENTAAETEIRAHGIAKAPHGAGRLLRVPRPLFAAPCLTRGANADIITLPYRSDGGERVPKGSQELTNARKNEILNACAALYETMSFKDITLKEIGKQTSFTRTSIYNYFHTKEEIFLALLQREYELWRSDLVRLHDENERMTAQGFAEALAHTLEKRERMLKLLSMNHYDLEARARTEKLVEFKVAYGGSIRAVALCLEKFFPAMSAQDIQGFIYAFFRFCSGPGRTPL